MSNLKLVLVGIFQLLFLVSCKDSNLSSVQKLLPFISTTSITESKVQSVSLDLLSEFPRVHFIWLESEDFEWLLDDVGFMERSANKAIECASELLSEDDLPSWWPRSFLEGFSRYYSRYCGGDSPRIPRIGELGNSNGFMEVLIKANSCYILIWEETAPI